MWFLFCGILIAVDQLTKLWAVNALTKVNTMPIIEGVFHLTYVENRGIAFGMLQGRIWIFVLITILAVIGIIYYYFRHTTYFDRFLRFTLMLIMAGAIGNLIDRLLRGFVVDMFDLRIINFYVFNVADICVCVGAALMLYYIIFMEGKHGIQRKNI